MEWVPQCYGTADKVQLGAFCVSEPDAGSDVSSLRTRAVYDEAKDQVLFDISTSGATMRIAGSAGSRASASTPAFVARFASRSNASR